MTNIAFGLEQPFEPLAVMSTACDCHSHNYNFNIVKFVCFQNAFLQSLAALKMGAIVFFQAVYIGALASKAFLLLFLFAV